MECKKELFCCDADDFGEMSLAEAISWLNSLAENQPCPPDQITFRVEQYGDSWDGYSRAQIKVFRAETPQEAAEREQEWARDAEERRRQQEAKERDALAALKAKYERQ